MSTFFQRVKLWIKSFLAVIFFTIFFCVTYLFRKTPPQYNRIRNEQVILLRQMKQKVSEWRMFTSEGAKSKESVPLNCLLKTDGRRSTDVQQKHPPKEKVDARRTKKEQKEQKRDSKKEKKRRDANTKDKPLATSTKIHTLIISDAQGKTVEEVHFMDEDYQEVLDYMRSKKKKQELNGGVSKLPT